MKRILSCILCSGIFLAFIPFTVNASSPDAYGTIEIVNSSSPNPVPNSYNTTINYFSYTPGYFKMMRVHFTYINTEQYFDYVKTSSGDSWSGYLEDVWSSWSYSDSIGVTLKTDSSVQSQGYYIDKVEYYTSVEVSQTWKTYVPYVVDNWNIATNNYNRSYTITAPSTAKAVRLHFSEIDTEKNWDFIEIKGNSESTLLLEKIHGTKTGVWSSWYFTNILNLTYKTDGSILYNGFKIDGYEYATTKRFPGALDTDHFPQLWPWSVNPRRGDGQRRLADRINYLPDSGNVYFADVSCIYKKPGSTIETTQSLRSLKLTFSWNNTRLRNLQIDGNDSIEMQTTFYNSGISGSDPAGRPTNSFYGWMTPIVSDTPPGSDAIGYNSYHDSGKYYFYKHNLPSSAYADTFYMDNVNPGQGNIAFAIGVSDTQQLNADYNYYYEIIADKGKTTSGAVVSEGIFSISGQRGYSYDNGYLANNTPPYLVFNEENEDRNLKGDQIIGLSNEYHAMDPMSSGKYFDLNEIIGMKDSRLKIDLLARNASTYSWNYFGDIYMKKTSSSSVDFTNNTRLWSAWNDNMMNSWRRLH